MRANDSSSVGGLVGSAGLARAPSEVSRPIPSKMQKYVCVCCINMPVVVQVGSWLTRSHYRLTCSRSLTLAPLRLVPLIRKRPWRQRKNVVQRMRCSPIDLRALEACPLRSDDCGRNWGRAGATGDHVTPTCHIRPRRAAPGIGVLTPVRAAAPARQATCSGGRRGAPQSPNTPPSLLCHAATPLPPHSRRSSAAALPPSFRCAVASPAPAPLAAALLRSERRAARRSVGPTLAECAAHFAEFGPTSAQT